MNIMEALVMYFNLTFINLGEIVGPLNLLHSFFVVFSQFFYTLMSYNLLASKRGAYVHIFLGSYLSRFPSKGTHFGLRFERLQRQVV